MREYAILQRHGNCRPFIIHVFKDIDTAKLKLYDLISLEEERRRPYFVDNDFFDNKYQFCNDLYYLQILYRDVGEYQVYSEQEIKNKDIDKIIFIEDYKKVLTN